MRRKALEPVEAAKKAIVPASGETERRVLSVMTDAPDNPSFRQRSRRTATFMVCLHGMLMIARRRPFRFV